MELNIVSSFALFIALTHTFVPTALNEKEKPMLDNPTWIKACWPYLAQESSWNRVGFTAHLAVGGLLFVNRIEKIN